MESRLPARGSTRPTAPAGRTISPSPTWPPRNPRPRRTTRTADKRSSHGTHYVRRRHPHRRAAFRPRPGPDPGRRRLLQSNLHRITRRRPYGPFHRLRIRPPRTRRQRQPSQLRHRAGDRGPHRGHRLDRRTGRGVRAFLRRRTRPRNRGPSPRSQPARRLRTPLLSRRAHRPARRRTRRDVRHRARIRRSRTIPRTPGHPPAGTGADAGRAVLGPHAGLCAPPVLRAQAGQQRRRTTRSARPHHRADPGPGRRAKRRTRPPGRRGDRVGRPHRSGTSPRRAGARRRRRGPHSPAHRLPRLKPRPGLPVLPSAGPVIRPAIITSRRPIVNSQGPPWLPGRRLAARNDGRSKTELNVLQLPAVTARLPARKSRRPVTYQEMARYLPQSGEPQARPMNTVPKLAVSATLTERRPGATLAWQEGDLDREIRALKQQPGGPARGQRPHGPRHARLGTGGPAAADDVSRVAREWGQQGDVRRLRADPAGIARHEGPGLPDRSARVSPRDVTSLRTGPAYGADLLAANGRPVAPSPALCRAGRVSGGLQEVADPAQAGERASRTARAWGSGAVFVTSAPALRDNARYRDWAARMERHTRSPGAAGALWRWAATIDVRPCWQACGC